MLIPERVLLFRLIFNLDKRPNTNKISLRDCNSSKDALEKKMVSSTNCKWDTMVLSLPSKNPSKTPFSSALTINLLKTLATKVKRKRERGFPYLRLLKDLTQPLALPFTKITKVIKNKQPLIQDLHLKLNLFLSRTWSKKS